MCNPAALSPSDAKEFLKMIYHDAIRKNGPIDFTQQIRTPKNDFSGKLSVKQSDLEALFSSTAWKEIKTKSGHRKLIHKVTHHVIEFGNHEKDIDPGAVLTILDTVQDVLNTLCNRIYAYTTRSWKTEPDYAASVKRWSDLYGVKPKD